MAKNKSADDLNDVIDDFDPQTATNKQKGNFGEIKSADNLSNNSSLKEKGYDLKRIGDQAPKTLDDKIKKGIDGIYENSTSPPKYVIDEAKYNSSKLNQKTKSGPQMSDDWIEKCIKKDQSLTKEQKDDIIKALHNKQVDRIVLQVDETGKVTTYKVDVNPDGKTSYGKTKWP